LRSWHTAYTVNRYLAINHHLAELIQRIFNPDISLRKANILLARKHYESFLKLLDSYDILSASDVKLFEAYTEDKASFSTANTRDAAARRDAKIARFREEKELKRKLEVRAFLLLLFRLLGATKTEPCVSSIFNKIPN
jgi:immunoglobulin-binding protein 1